MTNNYFKIQQFKKNILVFFDDTRESDIFNAFNKINSLRLEGQEVSVWNIPDIAGPWQGLRAIR